MHHNKRSRLCKRLNPLHSSIGEVDGYIEENNGSKYLLLQGATKKY